MSVIIEPIPFYETNYAWLLHDSQTKNAVIIDPGEFKPVSDTIKGKGLNLQSILITHFHSDHTGGVLALKEQYDCQVFAPDKERDKIPGATVYVQDQEWIDLGFVKVQVVNTPGHTLGSVCYYIPELKAVFTGDTLFSLGCGRLFEGSYEELFQSLQWIKRLPDDYWVYPAHEYTEENGKFALTLYPENRVLQNRMEQVRKLRLESKPTLPVLLSIEKKTNPFLLASTIQTFTHFRQAKDRF